MLTLIPVSLAQANEFVRQHHRHHKPVAGHKFSIGCAENGRPCAVAIVGRPVSQPLFGRRLYVGSQPLVQRWHEERLQHSLCGSGTGCAGDGLPQNYHLHLRHRERREPTRRRLDKRRICGRQGMDR